VTTMETRESTAYAVIATGGMSDVGAMADAGALVDPRIDAAIPALDPATGVRTAPVNAPSATTAPARPLSEVATEAARPLGGALINRPRNSARYLH
jgi:hypothetical protein